MIILKWPYHIFQIHIDIEYQNTYRTLIIRGSGLGKINILHAKDPYEAKYQFLSNKSKDRIKDL